MTGFLGGGDAATHDAASGRVRNLDCFVAVPGLGEPRDAEFIHLDVPWRSSFITPLVPMRAVPGLPAGLEALSRDGRLPWRRLAAAVQLARDGVDSRLRTPPALRCWRL